MQNIKVIIIEDDETIRNGYAYLIGSVSGYEVLNTYPSYESAEPFLAAQSADVILLDVELPGINGVDAIPKIKKLLPICQVIILTVYDNENTIFKALTNGAGGYLTKNTSPAKIIEAIKDVHDGGGAMSINVARMVIGSFQRNNTSPLTKRETEILEQIAAGKSRGKIAKDFFIDLETVKSHIKNIYQKLDVHSKADAIEMARKNKLI
jgi:DNA-binding NarL/FixJ family response regulator